MYSFKTFSLSIIILCNPIQLLSMDRESQQSRLPNLPRPAKLQRYNAIREKLMLLPLSKEQESQPSTPPISQNDTEQKSQ